MLNKLIINKMNLEKEYMSKNIGLRACNILKMIGNSTKYYAQLIPIILNNKQDVIDVSKNIINNWKDNSKGLYLIIHGLCGSPITFGYALSKIINDYDSNFDIALPLIPFRGNCSLDLASEPILSLLMDYINKNPGKAIHIISCSNGCRISGYIESKIRDIDVNIKITSIVGAYGGSRIMEQYSFPLQLILHNDIIKDLKLNSDTNNQLLNKMNSAIIKGSRHYEFYGTANDWYIPNIDDCFPDIEATTKIYHPLVEGFDHVSTAFYLRQKIFDDSIK